MFRADARPFVPLTLTAYQPSNIDFVAQYGFFVLFFSIDLFSLVHTEIENNNSSPSISLHAGAEFFWKKSLIKCRMSRATEHQNQPNDTKAATRIFAFIHSKKNAIKNHTV